MKNFKMAFNSLGLLLDQCQCEKYHFQAKKCLWKNNQELYIQNLKQRNYIACYINKLFLKNYLERYDRYRCLNNSLVGTQKTCAPAACTVSSVTSTSEYERTVASTSDLLLRYWIQASHHVIFDDLSCALFALKCRKWKPNAREQPYNGKDVQK